MFVAAFLKANEPITFKPKHGIWKQGSGEILTVNLGKSGITLALAISPAIFSHPGLVSIIQAGPRLAFEMEQILPMEDPDDFDTNPILEALEYHGCGDSRSAYHIMEQILTTDLRCHLGNWKFNPEPNFDFS